MQPESKFNILDFTNQNTTFKPRNKRLFRSFSGQCNIWDFNGIQLIQASVKLYQNNGTNYLLQLDNSRNGLNILTIEVVVGNSIKIVKEATEDEFFQLQLHGKRIGGIKGNQIDFLIADNIQEIVFTGIKTNI